MLLSDYVGEPRVHYYDRFLLDRIGNIERKAASWDLSRIWSCCCKGVPLRYLGRIVCWQFRQAITRDQPHANHPKSVLS